MLQVPPGRASLGQTFMASRTLDSRCRAFSICPDLTSFSNVDKVCLAAFASSIGSIKLVAPFSVPCFLLLFFPIFESYEFLLKYAGMIGMGVSMDY